MIYGEFAKCQAEAEYPELWNGLVGAWSPCLSPRGGTVLRDFSGRGKHGALTNMDPDGDWVASGGRLALDLDGSNDYVSITGFSLTDEFTISGWLKIASSRATLFSHASADTNSKVHNFGTTGSRVPYFQLALSDNTYFFTSGSPSALAAGVWHHLALTRRGATAKLYANGADITPTLSGSAATSLQPNTSAATIGFVPPTVYSDCQIADVVVTSIAEPHNDIAKRFRLGPGGWATPRRRRRYGSSAVIPYWAFRQQRSRIIGGGVS